MDPHTHADDDNRTSEPDPENPTLPLGLSIPSSQDPPSQGAPPKGSDLGDAPPQLPTDTPPGLPSPAKEKQGAEDFFAWLRRQNMVRGSNRWLGGVCSGVAAKLGVDPLIVRAAFLVLVIFAGFGVLLYGVAWALLPEPDGRIHAQEAGAGRWSTGMTGATIMSILGVTGFGGGFAGWGSGGFGGFLWILFWIGAAALTVYLIVDRRRQGSRKSMDGFRGSYPPDSTSGPARPAKGQFPAEPGYSNFSAAPTHGHPSFPGPSYGGVKADGASYSPVPGTTGTPSTPPRQQKTRATGPGAPWNAVVVGLALLVGGGLKGFDALGLVPLDGSVNAVSWGAGAGVLGLGIIVCALRGRAAGLLSLLAVLALCAASVASAASQVSSTSFRDVSFTPTTISQAQEGLDITAGQATVDLTALDLGEPLRSSIKVPIDATASNVTIMIPNSVPVTIDATISLGNLDQEPGYLSGTTDGESRYNVGKPGLPLIIEVDSTLSNITIQEGN
ncbi:PspC domain-containing protein [Pseudarthrobacter sp. PS3-L1]|uniref:PspC domain-containing protein n=1 Tax=Pseudarthrobacter sp. PS3-L1 TaxID=3046207 RepID=UPI0024B96B8E|nr:PspC domain-containing protein [Pseudarthrobacter sp. PS3-L1]MDJ0321259.1 PspC domain-containing protein [Pseudarthrobacter sp. PS3-L1]